MNSISFRLVSFLLCLVALTVVSNNRSARAEMASTDLSAESSEPAVATNAGVTPAVTPVATSAQPENHFPVSLESLKAVAATLQAVAPAATPVATRELGENHSTASLDFPKPVAAKLQAVATTATPVATRELGESHSTMSPESPKSATAKLQAVAPAATPVATSEPLESHSTVSLESPTATAKLQAVAPAAQSVATSESLESHSTMSLESPTATAKPQAVAPAAIPGTTVEAINPTVTKIPEDIAGQANVQPAHLAHSNYNQADSQKLQPAVSRNDQRVPSKVADATPVAKPTPGTLGTSAALLTGSLQTSTGPKSSSNRANSTVAQTEIQPGQATRGGRSYIGIGGNIGFGDTGLGSGAFAINSKIGLTSFLSVRPAVLFGDDVNFLIPITYDFTIESDDPFAPVPFAPFLGGGLVISTADGNNIGFLLTGGVDVPLSREFVANATLNIGFLEDSTDVGIMLGVGYTFPNFIR